MIPKIQIITLTSVLPKNVLTSIELEKRIARNSPGVIIPEGIIEILTGVKERRVASDDVNASDLATEAAKKALNKAHLSTKDIDCFIFAAQRL